MNDDRAGNALFPDREVLREDFIKHEPDQKAADWPGRCHCSDVAHGRPVL